MSNKWEREILSQPMDELLGLSELVHEIALHLPRKQRFEFALLGRKTWQSRIFHGDHTGRYGCFQLTLEQQEVVTLLNESEKPYQVYEGAASIGKTITTIVHLLGGKKPMVPVKDQDRVLIIAPPRLLEHWAREIAKGFPQFIDKNPNRSSVLVQSESYGAHLKRSYEVIQGGAFADHWRIALITPIRASNGTSINGIHFPCYWINNATKFGRLVVDEAHKYKHLVGRYVGALYAYYVAHPGILAIPVVQTPTIDRCLLLTANTIKLRKEAILGFTMTPELTQVVVRDYTVIAKHIPKYEYITEKEPPTKALPRLLKKYSKLVLFLNDIKLYEQYKKLKDLPGGLEIYQYTKAMSPITKFNETKGNALLLVTYRNASVGHNILAEAALFDRPEINSTAGFYQSLSRILRITNEAESVALHTYCENELEFYYKRCADELKRTEGLDVAEACIFRLNNGQVKRVLAKYQLKYEDVPALEFVWLCGPTARGPKNLLKAKFEEVGLDKDPRKKDILAIYSGKDNKVYHVKK